MRSTVYKRGPQAKEEHSSQLVICKSTDRGLFQISHRHTLSDLIGEIPTLTLKCVGCYHDATQNQVAHGTTLQEQGPAVKKGHIWFYLCAISNGSID